jgi:hypothetical protein
MTVLFYLPLEVLMNISLVKRASAFFPIAMSLAAFLLVLGHAISYGMSNKTDEGSAADIFQILLGLQVPLVLYLAYKWIPRSPGQALMVLALQAGTALAAMASVYLFATP